MSDPNGSDKPEPYTVVEMVRTLEAQDGESMWYVSYWTFMHRHLKHLWVWAIDEIGAFAKATVHLDHMRKQAERRAAKKAAKQPKQPRSKQDGSRTEGPAKKS